MRIYVRILVLYSVLLPAWEPTSEYDMEAKSEVKCHGDAVAARLLRSEFKWHDWISGLLKRNVIAIPNQ